MIDYGYGEVFRKEMLIYRLWMERVNNNCFPIIASFETKLGDIDEINNSLERIKPLKRVIAPITIINLNDNNSWIRR